MKKIMLYLIILVSLLFIFSVRIAVAITSDDFNSPTINESLWAIIDPGGDATFSMANTGSPYASLGITIPEGTSHDVYNGNLAPRIMQAAGNSDFEVEVKFKSLMNKTFQMQGIIIEQDELNFLRFDFHSKGQKIRVFCADFTNGSLSQINNREIGAFSNSAIPLYMRVKRVGNNWTQSYSFDGTHWIAQPGFNRILTVTSVGPFVGNADGTSAGTSSPAFTGLIDYFFNTSSPIVPEDVADTIAPNITVWYGNSLKFGQLGVPQQWVNILGNVYDESGVISLNYSLNNGNDSNLSIGPDYRLESGGDFNVEINHSELLCGDNQLVIKAADAKGNSKNEIVSVDYSCNNIWPQNYIINWSKETNIQDAAQIVDGLWIKEANTIRPGIIGYDRMIAIGEMTWKDYEITVPITINTPLDSSLSFGGPNFGIITRWQGHWDWDTTKPVYWSNKQPRPTWYPLGALSVYIWVPLLKDYRLRIIGNNMEIIADDRTGKHLDVGIPYMFKMRAQTNGTQTRYSLKVWQQNMTEPAGWTISGYGVAGELKQGSITLNAHNSDVSFGNVTILPTPMDTVDIVSQYAGLDGIVQRIEAVKAVRDYFNKLITKEDAVKVVRAYLRS